MIFLGIEQSFTPTISLYEAPTIKIADYSGVVFTKRKSCFTQESSLNTAEGEGLVLIENLSHTAVPGT